ncbi:MAG TPA: sugar phosphate isomerase/epimerase family protein [Chloroflexota bacterium]|nr:sugar phosphate isomerase/epimerase family protein [Chloroflexota bacterium]
MKLSLLTYNLARQWDLPKLIEVARGSGYAGIEFRADAGHEHGVELARSAAERRQIRDRLEDAYLEAVCIGTGCRYESPEPKKRLEQIEQTKRFVELAADVGSTRVRVFGNNLPDGVRRDDCVAYVGESLRTLGEFAAPFGVDVLLEMHGQFNYWGFARAAVEIANHPSVGIVYNCDRLDLVAGSVAATYSRVRWLIRHVHMHELTDGFPYPELFALLNADGYSGYVSSEIEAADALSREQYFASYAALVRSWAGLPFYAKRS